jgi:hypothetical protein
LDIFAILIGLIILAGSAYYIIRPLRRPRAGARSADAVLSLEAQRDAVYVQIKELDLDHATGKVNDDDYARLRAELVAQAAQILKQIDGVVPPAAIPVSAAAAGVPLRSADTAVDADVEAMIAACRKTRSAKAAPPAALDTDVEAAIAARRKTTPAAVSLTCPTCGKPIKADDAFCAKCGTALSLVK